MALELKESFCTDSRNICLPGITMFDVVLESIRAIILFGLILFLLKQEKSEEFNVSAGWRAIVYGFGLLLFGSLLDITDNFEQLNKYVVIGDTPTEALLEKLVGFLGGFILLAIGLVIWIPKYLNEKKESDDFFQKAFHSSPVLLAVSRSIDGAHYDVNETWSSITGFSHEEAMNKSASELGIWANPDDRLKLIDKLDQTGSVKGLETIFRTKNGDLRDMLISGEIIKIAGEKRIFLIGQDITRYKEIDRLKTEFISTISHELRTPLTSIKGSLGLIRSGTTGEFSDELGSMLDIAYNNSDRLVRLINDILDIEKIAAGKMDYKMEPMDLGSLLAQAIEANKGYGVEHGVRFSLTSELSEARVEGDNDRLMQVLANLLSNAAKFSLKGGTVEISLSKHDAGFRIKVADHGPGIPDNFQDKIFGKFHQADSSDTKSKGGTGLGLNIAKSIVEQHGGRIGFETQVGKGSTFFFDLPELKEREKV